jgi:hypothetical protein
MGDLGDLGDLGYCYGTLPENHTMPRILERIFRAQHAMPKPKSLAQFPSRRGAPRACHRLLIACLSVAYLLLICCLSVAYLLLICCLSVAYLLLIDSNPQKKAGLQYRQSRVQGPKHV